MRAGAYPRRQRGLTLFWVAIGSALLALAAMAALYSMRHERNLFAEGAAAVASNAGAAKAVELAAGAKGAVAGTAGGGLRRCVVKGKTIVSNSDADCAASNPTSKAIDMVIPKGVVTPKKAEPAASAPTSNPALDKIIEKQLH